MTGVGRLESAAGKGLGLKQKIVGFHTDAEGHWVAELECGHRQHVRHDPPLVNRPWVLSHEGREGRIGLALDCKKCDEADVPCPRTIS